ncbi:LPO_1073/Vpar_1526 family protein [Novispirillum itersonii]|uniref:LPO_1073/Vpar_1526 family protein n=1 Tax=Novispirillum itersonii TaxID=189 RepID=UPI0003659D18|nr:LPO_1073/Vpar_1526 family protein [Novispirillum itersonii]
MADKNDQDQEVGENSFAIQSGRDTNIGLSPEQMGVILEALAKQLPAYTAVARQIVDDRLEKFEERLILRFTTDENANSEAFKDPDFQSLLTRGQHAYARSGDEMIQETLVDLIVERSKHGKRSRLSLSLNDAVEKSALLTVNEFAEITLIFSIHHVRIINWVSPESLGRFLSDTAGELLPFIENTTSSYAYMQSLGCGSLNNITSLPFGDVFNDRFRLVFSPPHMIENVAQRLGQQLLDFLIANDLIKRFNPENVSEVRFDACSHIEFAQRLAATSLDQEDQNKIKVLVEEGLPTVEDFRKAVTDVFPKFEQLKAAWDDTPINKFTLTTTGIAIGHTNFYRLSKLSPPLSIWIQ